MRIIYILESPQHLNPVLPRISPPSSATEELKLTGVTSQSRRHKLLSPTQRVLSSDLQVHKLHLPLVVLQRGADETKDLLIDSKAGFVSVDSPSHSHQHQAMGGGQSPEAMGLQVGAQEEPLIPGQG